MKATLKSVNRPNISKSIKVQISNELPDQVGRLTSCNDNFNVRMRTFISKMS